MTEINPNLSEYICPEGNKYKDIGLVQKDELAAQQFYSALYDRFVCRCTWEDVPVSNTDKTRRFFGFFAGFYQKAEVGALHLRIQNFLDKPWRWVLAVERGVENKNLTETVIESKLGEVYQTLRKYGLSLEKYGFLIGGYPSRDFYSFAELTNVPGTFDEVCSYMEHVLKCLRVCAAPEERYKNSLK